MRARRLGAAGVFALALSVMLPRPCFALATEHFGNDAVRPGFVALPAGALGLVNLASRFYWREVNGDPMFYCRGDMDALHEALRQFAALDGVKELVLVPGPDAVRSFAGGQRMPYDWSVHLPAGFSFAFELRRQSRELFPANGVLVVRVPTARPGRPPDAAALARWIGELDHQDAAVRDRASRELEKLGAAAGPALRRLQTGSASAEALRRAGLLLAQLPAIDLDRLVVPAGVTVLEAKDLAARYRAGLTSANPTVRGLCAGLLADLALSDAAVLSVLMDVFRQDPHEYVRRTVAGALSTLGREGTAALATLREGLRDPDANVRVACQQAIGAIEAAPEDPGQTERRRQQRAILEDIARFRTALPAR